MRAEYFQIGPLGIACAIAGGALLHSFIEQPSVIGCVMLCVMFLAVRSDILMPVANGAYRRTWGLWRHETSPIENSGPHGDPQKEATR